jgi:8-oxo-dGTP pyrophosphatase MutT (NUDIX family)
MVHDVFQKGLIRGTENLPFDPSKAYFYVEHPTEGWRVYLRSCCFIHEKPSSSLESNCIDPMRFVVVKKNGAPINSSQWEPPKGQMEGKDMLMDAPLMDSLLVNAYREVVEESGLPLEDIVLRHSGFVYQSREKDYPPNHYFQYHIFQAVASPQVLAAAEDKFKWLNEHPAYFAKLRADKREKDGIRWYDAKETRLMGRWSPSIVALYLQQAAAF